MPFVLAGSASHIVYAPNQMSQQGKTIADDAQQLANNTKTFWHQFQQVYQTMPQAVQANLQAFENTNQPYLDQLMSQRITIGHLLSGAASQMEQEDGKVQYSFYENIPLATLAH